MKIYFKKYIACIEDFMSNTARIKMNYNTVKNIAKTLSLIIAITLFIFYLVLRKSDPGDLLVVFFLCIITGLCNYTIVKIAIIFIQSKPTKSNYFLQAFLLLMGAFCGSALSFLFYHTIEGNNAGNVPKTVFFYSFIFGAFFYGGLLYYYNSKRILQDSERKANEEKIKRLTLEKETALTTLKVLQAQIEPHFLFNTLSNIISLLEIDIKKSKKMLLDLNDYLRTSLQITRKEIISLEQELSLVGRYLDIFKVRMGKRLIYKIERIGDCSKISFPPMIIQPLVENAILYGLEPKKDGGHINIRCETDQYHLKITVSDSGMGVGKNNNMMGIGLNNISKRLNNIYGDQATLTLTDNEPSGLKAIIEVTL
jgi:sensor histidine kinase YesM